MSPVGEESDAREGQELSVGGGEGVQEMEPLDAAKRYELALQLMQWEINVLWVTFGVFLIVETVLLGAVGQLFSDGSSELALGGAILGCILVVPWWTTFEYGRKFYLLRIEQALDYETRQKDCTGKLGLLQEGAKLAHGKQPRTRHLPQKEKIKVLWLFRCIRPRHAGLALMALFFIAFAGIAVAPLLED